MTTALLVFTKAPEPGGKQNSAHPGVGSREGCSRTRGARSADVERDSWAGGGGL